MTVIHLFSQIYETQKMDNFRNFSLKNKYLKIKKSILITEKRNLTKYFNNLKSSQHNRCKLIRTRKHQSQRVIMVVASLIFSILFRLHNSVPQVTTE